MCDVMWEWAVHGPSHEGTHLSLRRELWVRSVWLSCRISQRLICFFAFTDINSRGKGGKNRSMVWRFQRLVWVICSASETLLLHVQDAVCPCGYSLLRPCVIFVWVRIQLVGRSKVQWRFWKWYKMELWRIIIKFKKQRQTGWIEPQAVLQPQCVFDRTI